MTKKADKQVDVKSIEEQIEKHIANVEGFKAEYRKLVETLKDIEKSITIEAGAIAALRSLIYVSDDTLEKTEEGGDK